MTIQLNEIYQRLEQNGINQVQSDWLAKVIKVAAGDLEDFDSDALFLKASQYIATRFGDEVWEKTYRPMRKNSQHLLWLLQSQHGLRSKGFHTRYTKWTWS